MSDPDLTRRALALLDEALDLPEAQREPWLAGWEDTDPALARELRLLMAAMERQGVLDVPPELAREEEWHAALGAALHARYDVQRQIGRGGMATVYLAQECKHERQVVIKVLDPTVAQLFGADRFLREIRIAATLAHPHIVPLIDSGEADGFLYYVMPWMEGETLRDRLGRGRPSLGEAMTVLRDVADALRFAHEAGIVHRDLKPENVLLTAGHAYLLDFGIAKLLDESAEAGVLTSPGLPLGTRRYMAPEQVVGAPDVDARADVYAWGVMAAEVLTGASLAPTDAEASARRLLEAQRDVPRAFAVLIQACVAAEPERRPATMAELIEWLDAIALSPLAPPAAPSTVRRHRPLLWAAALALVAAVPAFAFWGRRAGTVEAAPAEPVAVTVLRNETGDRTLDVLGRFAGDWVTEGLQRTGLVRVVPWSEARVASERALEAGTPLVAALRDQLHAGTVVTGSVYLRRDSLHYHVQLIDARSGRLVSSLPRVIVPADRSEGGISQLRDRVMGAVAAMRDARVSSLPEVTGSPPTFSAYQAFDLGFDHYLGQRYSEALGAFRQAFERDTTFTLALLLGARAAWNVADYAAAESLVARARAQRGDLGTYHESVLRFLEALLQGDGARAQVAIQRAAAVAPNSRASYDLAASLLNAGLAREARAQLLAMNPDQGELLGWSSYWTQRAHAAYLLGHHDDALHAAREMARRYPGRRVAQVLEARALASAAQLPALDSALAAWDSLPADVYWSQGAALVVAGEELMRRGRGAAGRVYSERAVTWLTNRLVSLPTDRAHRYWLGSALYDLGRFEEAQPYFEGLARDYPERLQFRGLAAVTAARRGDFAAAERWLGSAPARDRGHVLSYEARIAAIAGDHERAISLLTAALEAGIDGFPWLPGSAFRDWEGIVRTPRGRALLAGR